MMGQLLYAVWLFVIVWTLPLLSAAQPQADKFSQSRSIGWIEEIRGRAYLKQGADGTSVLLHPKRDRVRRLTEGESVKCGPGGYLKLLISGNPVEIKESSNWFPIQAFPSPKPEIVKAIESYGRVGGRDRGFPSEIISPSPESTVRAESLVFQWVPKAYSGTVSLMIKNATGQEIWRQDNVDAASGQLVSNDARQALIRYRPHNEPEQMSFIMMTPGKNEVRVYFYLLSKREEETLHRELEMWNHYGTGLIRYVGRAYSFSRYKLYSESAAEYEAALLLAPESHDLRVATMNVYRSTGNLSRINELKRLLPSPAEVPQ
jgi:hypothetical protein